MTSSLSTDDYALYDRQIRLWGAQAQQLIGQAHVLIISMRALGTEIAKNLTLAGVAQLTIIDDSPVLEEDLGACYFLREEDLGKPRAESAIPRLHELNSRVKIQSGGRLLDLPAVDETFFAPFTIIIACDLDSMNLSLVNIKARLASKPFYAAGIHGEYGFIFADLVDHMFVVERDQSNVPPSAGTQESPTRSIVKVDIKREPGAAAKEVLTKRELYCPLALANTASLEPAVTGNRRKLAKVPPMLPALRALFDFQGLNGRFPDPSSGIDLAAFTAAAKSHAQLLLLPEGTLTADFLRAFIPALGAELPTTASFIGSRLSEDVINAITYREQPIQNFAFFDGDSGPIYCLYSPPPEAVFANAPVLSNGVAETLNGEQLPETGGIQFPVADTTTVMTV